jgi:hypothetical protein
MFGKLSIAIRKKIKIAAFAFVGAIIVKQSVKYQAVCTVADGKTGCGSFMPAVPGLSA